MMAFLSVLFNLQREWALVILSVVFVTCGAFSYSFFNLPGLQPMESMQMPAPRAPGNYGEENGSRKRRGGKHSNSRNAGYVAHVMFDTVFCVLACCEVVKFLSLSCFRAYNLYLYVCSPLRFFFFAFVAHDRFSSLSCL